MRTIGNWNNPAESLPLPHVVVDPHGAGRLDDSSNAAKCSRLQKYRQVEAETPFRPTSVLGAVSTVDPVEVVVGRWFGAARGYGSWPSTGRPLQQCLEIFALSGDPLLSFRSQRWNSAIGWIDDHRRSRSPLERRITEPVIVVCACDILFAANAVTAVAA